MPFARAGARLQGTGLTIHAARRDPCGNPLLRFPPPPGFLPARPAARLSTCGTSRGLPSPTALAAGGVYVVSAGRSRSGRLRSVLRVRALSTVYSSTHLATRFRAATLLGLSLQGFIPPGQAHQLPPAGFPSWRSSLSLRAHDLGIVRTGGATPDDLGGSPSVAFCRLQGVTPSESPYRSGPPFKWSRRPIPSWVSASLGSSRRPRQRDFHPRRSRASPPPAPPSDLAAPKRSRLRLHPSVSCPDDSAVLSRGRLPLRGFPPTYPAPCEVTRSWPISLAGLGLRWQAASPLLANLYEPSNPLPCGRVSALFRRSASGFLRASRRPSRS